MRNTAEAFYLCGISTLIENTHLYHVTQSSYVFALVEAAGIEPASENPSTSLSPGAEGCQHSLTYQSTVKLICLVASLCMVRSKLCALTDATDPRLYPVRGPTGRDGRHYLGSDSNCVVVV